MNNTQTLLDTKINPLITLQKKVNTQVEFSGIALEEDIDSLLEGLSNLNSVELLVFMEEFTRLYPEDRSMLDEEWLDIYAKYGIDQWRTLPK